MAIPNNDRIEYIVSSIGIETYPQSVIAKNSLWTLQLGYGRFFLKEYDGYFCVINNVIVKRYLLTIALKTDLTIDNDRFWVWILDSNDNLSLYEWEPYVDSSPSITLVKSNIATNVLGISTYVKENEFLRVIVLSNSLELKMYVYPNIKTSNPPLVSTLSWDSSRLYEISNFINTTNTSLDISYLDVLSPPNVYLDTYYIPVPQNFTVTQISETNRVLLLWDTVSDASYYVIQRDISPLFESPVEFSTTSTTYTDEISEVGNYYYRVLAFNESLYLQSEWSEVKNIELILNADFVGDPTLANVGNVITFTDLSTPTGAIDYWEWDFGDGSPKSYDQNPTHIYNDAGIFTVTLTVKSGATTDVEVKENYITIATALTADFEAIPTSGNANLAVQFFDRSEGEPIYWEWDFGDGSPKSYEQNPLHVYTTAGTFTVTLIVKDDTFTSTITKIDYIVVNMVADFSASITTGPADLFVKFTDLTVGNPDSWYWDFGDGFTSNEQNPEHIYTQAGTYAVTLTASNSQSSDTITKAQYITVYAVANFYGVPRRGYSSLEVQFTDASSGTPLTWFWDFGDGEYSEEANPVHYYKKPGIYTVSLSITTTFNNSIETKVGYIIVSGIATPDIAPEPDIKAYLNGYAECYDLDKGVRIKYLTNKKKDL